MFDMQAPVPDDTDDLGCARGIINATPIALILWGVIIGALLWVL